MCDGCVFVTVVCVCVVVVCVCVVVVCVIVRCEVWCGAPCVC